MKKIFVSFFYIGFLRPAPGTWGSVAGALIAYFIYEYLGRETLFLASIALFLFSIKIIDSYEAELKIHDASHIVIDEVAGVWLAIALSASGVLGALFGLLFFRLFDISKPSLIGKIDKNVKGGLGVMADDMLAGVFAGICSAVLSTILEHFGINEILSKPWI